MKLGPIPAGPFLNPGPIRYGTVCTGIGGCEAAIAASPALAARLTPAFMSEIEAFPRTILKHHYEDTPLHGDFRTITAAQHGPASAGSIRLLVGGTPCQSFSVAGLRGGLQDERGNLAREFLALADRLRPEWLVWENVPGVLSSNGGRDFGSFLGGLGVIGYGWAYATLDAQYFGLAQRRARVFVVGRLGDWRGPCAVLFERASLSGDPAPRREAGQRASRPVAGSSATSSGYRNDADRADDLIPAPTLSHPLAQALTQSGRGVQRVGEPRGQDPVIATQAPPQVVGSMPASGGTEKKHGHGWGQQEWESGYIQPVEAAPSQVHGPSAPTPALAFKPGQSERAGGITATQEFAPTLQGQDNNLIPAIAFALRGRAEGAQPEIHRDGDQASALRSASGGSSRDYVAFQANGRDEVRLQGGDGDQAGSLAATGGVRRGTTTLLAFDTTQLSHPENRSNPKPGGPAPTLAPGASAPAIAFSIVPEGGQGSALRASEITTAPALTPTAEGRSTDRGARIVTPAPQGFTLHGADQTVSTASPTELAAALRARTPGKIENATTTAVLAPAAPTASAVRRLTPTECERLQGFPDGYTQVTYRGKPAADGPRYKALGNAFAVPVIGWILERLVLVDDEFAQLRAEGRL